MQKGRIEHRQLETPDWAENVILEIIWRLLFRAIWHMPKTKGVDWRDRPGCFLALAVGRALVGLVG